MVLRRLVVFHGRRCCDWGDQPALYAAPTGTGGVPSNLFSRYQPAESASSASIIFGIVSQIPQATISRVV